MRGWTIVEDDQPVTLKIAPEGFAGECSAAKDGGLCGKRIAPGDAYVHVDSDIPRRRRDFCKECALKYGLVETYQFGEG